MHAGLILGPPYSRMCTRMGPTLYLFIILAGICNGFRWQEWLGLATAPGAPCGGPRLFRRGTHETTQVGNPEVVAPVQAVVVPVQADPVADDSGAEDQPPQQPAALVVAERDAIPDPLVTETVKTEHAEGPSDEVQAVAEGAPVEAEVAVPKPAVLGLSTAPLVSTSALESPEKPKEDESGKAPSTGASLKAKTFHRRKFYTTSHPPKRTNAGRGSALPPKPAGLPGLRERGWSSTNLHGNGVQSDPLPKTTTAATFGLVREKSKVNLPTEPANESILAGGTPEGPLQDEKGAEPLAVGRKVRAALRTSASNHADDSTFPPSRSSWICSHEMKSLWWNQQAQADSSTPLESAASVSPDEEGKFSDAEGSASAAHQSGPRGDLLAKRHTQTIKLADSQIVTVAECSSSLSMLSSSMLAQTRMRSSWAWGDEAPQSPKTPRRRMTQSGVQSLASSAMLPRDSERSEQSEDEVHAAESLLHNSAASAGSSAELKL